MSLLSQIAERYLFQRHGVIISCKYLIKHIFHIVLISHGNIIISDYTLLMCGNLIYKPAFNELCLFRPIVNFSRVLRETPALG